MQELIHKVIKWAEERNLIEGSSPARQIYKTMEEATELAVSIGAYDLEASYDEPYLNDHIDAIADAIGDVTVTLIIIAEQVGVTFESCVEAAYEQIKDRRGKMMNGIFVKEA